MRFARELYDQLVAHARAEAPNECCGMIGRRDGEPASFYPIRNEFESPTRFRLHGDDLPGVYAAAEAAGEQLDTVYHSHPKSEAYPSQTDINIANELAGWFPGGVWVIASLADDEPSVRAFTIDGNSVEELDVDVE